MRVIPQALYTAQVVRELEHLAMEQAGVTGLDLMNRAGAAVLRELRRRWPEAMTIAVVCGMGNNGGDGFVVARLARQAGLAVRLCLLGEPARLEGDARSSYEALQGVGVAQVELADARLSEADVIVDALFGTGLDRALSGVHLHAVQEINKCGVPVIAVDIPSGLHADTGAVLGAAVRAHVTVSFIGLKQGLLTGRGPAFCGELVFEDIAVPSALYAQATPSAWLTTDPDLAEALPPRERDAHKGCYGHVLIIGGDRGMAGAPRMAALAAARVGAGLVTVATHPQHASLANALQPEIMSHAVADRHGLAALLRRATVAAVGPGLGLSDWGKELFDAALDSGLPLLVDADALNLLAQEPQRRDDWVLTPHPGEAARLLQSSPDAVQADRFEAARALQQDYGGIVVLKGAGTVIAGPAGPLGLCAAGNPGMAAGGMGDVLSGVIVGLMVQGLNPQQAARVGVHLHARAADEAAAAGERGMMATDLLPCLRHWANP